MSQAVPTTQDPIADDGVTHFALDFQRGSPPAAWQVEALLRWRARLHALELVGQSPRRYGGIGFGNLSCRHPGRPRAFIITGTQTGARARLCAHDLAVVTRVDLRGNRVIAHGGTAPSSEALTHAALYASDGRIGHVFHGHTPLLWQRANALGIRSTPASVGYGTVAMAEAVGNLLQTDARLPMLLKMGGHEDGIIAFGADADETGDCLEAALARAQR